jgi:hypothetical protein
MARLYGFAAPPNGPNGSSARAYSEADSVSRTGIPAPLLKALLKAGQIRHTPAGQAWPVGYIFLTYKWPPGSTKMQEGLAAGPNYGQLPALPKSAQKGVKKPAAKGKPKKKK